MAGDAQFGVPPKRPYAEWIWRLFGFGTALLYLGLGSILVFMLLIGGLWEGFGRTGYVLYFFAVFIYVYGTAALALWLGFRPSKPRGILLAVLVIPGVLNVVLSSSPERSELREAAHVFVANEESAQAELARETLMASGRRAGRQGHVDILLEALALAKSDAERVRLVCVLGELSYQYEPLLNALRELKAATADDSGRSQLHEVVIHALVGVNPYEGMGPGQGAAQRPPQPQVCWS